jgi:guanylate kinase
LEVNPPGDEKVQKRLISMAEDKEEVVRKIYKNWQKQSAAIEEHYRYCVH